jgi:hypothetical protein
VIACATSSDHLIAAGVSNWGAWGLLAAAEGAIRYGIAVNDVDGRELPLEILSTVEKATLCLVGKHDDSDNSSMKPAITAPKRASSANVSQEKNIINGAHTHPPPGAWLLPTDSEERELVRAMNASGAADGITGERDGSVDGMGLDKHINVLRELRGMILTEFT